MKQTLENLKKLTKENIENRKNISPKIPKKYSEISEYYNKYLKKSVCEFVPYEKITVTGKNGKLKEENVKFENAVMHHNNTLLAMAFSKAEKLFTSLKKDTEQNIKVKGAIKQVKERILNKATDETSNADNRSLDETPLTAIECLILSRQFLQGKNSALIKSLKKGSQEKVDEFRNILPIIYKALQELRNYHSHIFHEPGPLKFEDLYGKLRPKDKNDNEKWQIAKYWFRNKMEEVQQHLVKSLNKQLNDESLDEQEKSDVQKVLSTISGYEFEKDGNVTQDALLFIACMFLRKSDAEYFVKKWTRGKKAEGVFKTGQNFFTYYSVRDKKSLQTQNVDLFKFRKIIGVLSTMPEFANNCFLPFNELIHKHNEDYGKQIEDADTKADKEELNSFCFPIRKGFSPTKWYMDYLNNKGYLNDSRIACYKMPEDRDDFLDENINIPDGALVFLYEGGEINRVATLKSQMKKTTGATKKELTEIYKNAKKNFLFKNPQDIFDEYCIKNQTVMIQYSPGSSKNNITIQANLSSDLLMKWVFADIILGKGEEIGALIKDQLTRYYNALINGDFEGIEPRLMPSSVADVADNPTLKYSIAAAEKLIEERKKQLIDFYALNNSRNAPWKFAAKKKINILFDFVHLSYSIQAINNNKDVDKRRHDALNDLEYLDALEYIRFYGRYQGLPDFIKFFEEDKRVYFQSLIPLMKKAKTLEELFNLVYDEFISLYDDIYKKLVKDKKGTQLDKFIKLFKPHVASNLSDREYHAKLFATNQVVLHGIIDIRKYIQESTEYTNVFTEWKSKMEQKPRVFKDSFTADFSLMRHILTKRNRFDTNSDYIMKIIMPELLQKKLLDINDKGKLQGNTAMFNTLMKNKIDELMMWEIAKYYWVKTYKKDIGSQNFQTIPQLSATTKGIKRAYRYDKEGKEIACTVRNTPYKKSMLFYKLFTDEIKLVLSSDEYEETYEIKIKPKKFDDEFQYYEIQKELYNFIRSHKPKKSEDGWWHFEDLNKEMKDSIAKYLDDVYLLLNVEKDIVQKDYESLSDTLHKKLEDKWGAYYLPFGTNDKEVKNDPEKDKIENALSKMIFGNIHPLQNGFELHDLVIFRNNVLHQQIQPDMNKYVIIKKSLINYCVKNMVIN